MQNLFATIISQYANSPTIVQLIKSMNEYLDPSANIDQFYNKIWNIYTAEGYGLDVWGRILQITRSIYIPAIYPVFIAPGWTNLDDDQYRKLLLVKALANITNCTAPGINAALKALFLGRGFPYVKDLGDMHMQYVFLFPLEPFEYAIMTGGVIPRPVAVGASLLTINPYLGFNEAFSWEPFDQAIFASY